MENSPHDSLAFMVVGTASHHFPILKYLLVIYDITDIKLYTVMYIHISFKISA